MSEPKFTPGPWRLNPEERHPWVVECSVRDDPSGFGRVCKIGYRPNANLIAAAPELYEVAQELKEAFRFALLCTTPEIARDGMEFVRKAEAALAKARGDTPSTQSAGAVAAVLTADQRPDALALKAGASGKEQSL